MNDKKSKILVIADFYLPGYKSGALRTVVNMVERLSNEFEFYILTQNFDSDGDQSRYLNVKLYEWQKVGNARVYYAPAEWFKLTNIRKLCLEISPDAVYLNSLFSSLTIKFLILLRLAQFGQIPVVLAPEGEFSTGALQLKNKKKLIFLKTALPLGLYQNLIWKAAAEEEKSDIERETGIKNDIFVAPNMPPRMILEEYSVEMKAAKKNGELNLVFLSRISPKKNLGFALDLLKIQSGKIKFDIYGSLEDEVYWRECEKKIAALPKQIEVSFYGAIGHEQVAETIAKYHFFILPTLGENFGHVVIEALASGCPVLLSDQTPWRNLAVENAGWDLPLDKIEHWRQVLQQCVDMPAEEYLDFAQSARNYAVKWLAAPEIEDANRAVLRHAINNYKK